MRWIEGRWVRVTGGVLLAWLVAREFGIADFALARTAARHGSSTSAAWKRDGVRRNQILRDDPLDGMEGLQAMSGAIPFQIETPLGGSDESFAAAAADERATARTAERGAKRREWAAKRHDPAYAAELAAALQAALVAKLAGEPRLADATITVDVVYATRRGFAWVPLWKEVGADVAMNVAIVPRDPALPTLDVASQHSEWQSIHGSASRRHVRARCDAMVIERLAAGAAASARERLAEK
ncbi:MAG: hypothetical protein JNL90_01030 [Planctomycetes bacterium]|nr:hypothetical protein [Planctomycetota bacterium]